MSESSKSILLIIGGILQIIMAHVCMFFGLLGVSSVIAAIRYGTVPYREFILQFPIGVVGTIASVFGLSGGISVLMRKHFILVTFGNLTILAWNMLVIACAIINYPPSSIRTNILTLFSFFLILSFLSLAFILASRKKFYIAPKNVEDVDAGVRQG